MPSFLSLDSLSLHTPDGRALFTGLTLAFHGERTGLVGRNGCGKSTLLHILAGLARPSGGTVTRTGTVGLLRQDWPDTGPLAEALGVGAGLARLDRLLRGHGTAEDAAEADWSLQARLDAALAEVGLPNLPLDRPLAALSGGERTRIAIARVLLDAPDILLLDEPTNNLDAAGRLAIGRLIAGWRGGVVVASHDRALLEGMDRIVALSPVGCTVVGGGWSVFQAARDAGLERAEAELDRAQRDLRGTERAIQQQRERKARRDKTGRAERASGSNAPILMDFAKERAERSGGRDSRLAQRLSADAQAGLEAAREKVEVLTPLRIDLPPTGLPAQRELLRFEAVTLLRGGHPILGPLSFEIRGPERVALSGRNGAGKTSLLHLATGALAPSTGSIARWDGGLVLLDQHVGMLERAASVLDNLRRLNPDLSDHDARAALARFAFRNQAAMRLVGTLSGGERLRAGLACALSARQPPQLLLLDEPTNHLDLDSVEVLEAALVGFDGALLVASHDPAFLQAIGIGRIISLDRPAAGA